MSTSLGVCQGNDHADFVFGGRSNSNGLSFKFAKGLYREESLVQQQLDFIQRLYLKQASPGEFFQQIHLGGFSPPHSAEPYPPVADCQGRLHELLQTWIKDQELDLLVEIHNESTVQQRKALLERKQLLPSALSLKEFDLTHTYSLWSLAYSETPELFDASAYKTFKTINYNKIDNLNQRSLLADYKQDLIRRFSASKFSDYESENERHYLITLAGDPESTRYELLHCQESIKELLEKKTILQTLAEKKPMSAKTVGAENAEQDMPDAIEKFCLNEIVTPNSSLLSALSQPQNIEAQLAVDMDMDRTAEIPTDLTSELTAEIDDDMVAELTAEITQEISSELTRELTTELGADGTQETPDAFLSSLASATLAPAPIEAEAANVEAANVEAASSDTAAETSRSRTNTTDSNWYVPNARVARRVDSWLFRLALLAGLPVLYYIFQR